MATYAVFKLDSDDFGTVVFEGNLQECKEFCKENDEKVMDEGYYLKIDML